MLKKAKPQFVYLIIKIVFTAAMLFGWGYVYSMMGADRLNQIIFASVSFGFSALMMTLIWSGIAQNNDKRQKPFFKVLISLSAIYLSVQSALCLFFYTLLDDRPVAFILFLLTAILTGVYLIFYTICVIGKGAIIRSENKSRAQLEDISLLNREIRAAKMKADHLEGELQSSIYAALDRISDLLRDSKQETIGDVSGYNLSLKENINRLAGLIADIDLAVEEQHNLDDLIKEFERISEDTVHILRERDEFIERISNPT